MNGDEVTETYFLFSK